MGSCQCLPCLFVSGVSGLKTSSTHSKLWGIPPFEGLYEDLIQLPRSLLISSRYNLKHVLFLFGAVTVLLRTVTLAHACLFPHPQSGCDFSLTSSPRWKLSHFLLDPLFLLTVHIQQASGQSCLEQNNLVVGFRPTGGLTFK